MLGREAFGLAVGGGLTLGRLRVLELVDVRLDDRDALGKLVVLGGREVAPRRRRRLTGGKADQLLLEQIELGGACAALGGHRGATCIDEYGIGIRPPLASSAFSSASSACFSAVCSSRAAVARVAISRRRPSNWSRSALIVAAELFDASSACCASPSGSLLDALCELLLARFLLQRLELLLGFGDPLRRPLGGFLEALGGRGARRRRLELAERVAQLRDRLIANVRRHVGARLELLDASFHALDGAVGRFRCLIGARRRSCGGGCTGARSGRLSGRIRRARLRLRCRRGRRCFLYGCGTLYSRRCRLGRGRCLRVRRHRHRQQGEQERDASQFQMGECCHGAEVAASLCGNYGGASYGPAKRL